MPCEAKINSLVPVFFAKGDEAGEIIAILAAILFPVFARAREKARQTACLSNAKQISIGVLTYIQDYDEMYPTINFNRYLKLTQSYM